MAFDPNYDRMKTNHQRKVDRRREEINDRAHEVMLAVGGRLTLNPSDETIEAIEVLLGIETGGTARAFELLGVQPAEDDESPRALNVAPERPMDVYNADGTRAGVALREDEARMANLVRKTDTDGNVIGWQPMPDLASSTIPVTTPVTDEDPGEKMVEVRHKGTVRNHIKVSDGLNDHKLKDHRDPTGNVEYFTVKSRLGVHDK